MSQEWNEGSVHVSLLHGQCRIAQGDTVLRARKMVVFQETDSSTWDKRDRLTVYLEDDVRIDRPGQSVTRSVMVVHLVTRAGLTHQIRSRAESTPARRDDPLYRRAEKRVAHGRRQAVQSPVVRQTQLLVPGSDPTDPEFRSVQIQSPAGSLRRVRISPRSAVPYNILSFESTATTPPVLEALGLAQYFDVVSCGDAVPYKKPDGRHVRLVVEELGASVETAAMIGDSENDIYAAIDAGVRSVCVTFGYAHVPCDELGADALIDHFDDLAGALVDISKAAAS